MEAAATRLRGGSGDCHLLVAADYSIDSSTRYIRLFAVWKRNRKWIHVPTRYETDAAAHFLESTVHGHLLISFEPRQEYILVRSNLSASPLWVEVFVEEIPSHNRSA
jgi:hypothetical protein